MSLLTPFAALYVHTAQQLDLTVRSKAGQEIAFFTQTGQGACPGPT
jgi:hypothetical protein